MQTLDPTTEALMEEASRKLVEKNAEIDRLNNAIAMTLDMLQKRHGSASYPEDVDAAERFLKAQYRP